MKRIASIAISYQLSVGYMDNIGQFCNIKIDCLRTYYASSNAYIDATLDF